MHCFLYEDSLDNLSTSLKKKSIEDSHIFSDITDLHSDLKKTIFSQTEKKKYFQSGTLNKMVFVIKIKIIKLSIC